MKDFGRAVFLLEALVQAINNGSFGGGGGGNATAANQVLTNDALAAINTILGTSQNELEAANVLLATIEGKLIASPATEAGQSSIEAVLEELKTLIVLGAGTNTIGNVGIVPRTTGGLSIFKTLDLDETEEVVKASAGQVYGYYYHNKSASIIYLKWYNDTVANVTVGTTIPVMTMGIPAGAAAHISFPIGIAFSTAITVAATTGIADNDTGAPAANDLLLDVFYN